LIINSVTGPFGPSFGQPNGAAPAQTAPTITTTSLPAATVGVAYSAQLAATGNPSSFTWLLTSGNKPGWLTVSTGGALSGTPQAGDVTTGINLTFSCSNGVLPNANSGNLSLVVGVDTLQPLLQPSDITYLGYYDLNLGIGDPYYGQTIAIRRVGSETRMLVSIFPGNGQSTRTVAEVNISAATINSTISSTVNTWTVDVTQNGVEPLWEYGWSGQGPTYGACESIMWDSTNNFLIRSSFIGYPQAGVLKQAWLDILNVPDSGGSITRSKRLYVGSLMDTRIGGGFSEVPSEFRSTYNVGPYALGTGCYTSLVANYPGGAPMGFTTYSVPDTSSYANKTTLPTTTMASHDPFSSPSNLGKKMYFGYTFNQTGTKTFTSTEVNAPGGNPAYNGVTVPVGTFTSSQSVVGPVDYLYSASDPRGNGQTGNAPNWDPFGINPAGNGVTYGDIGNGQTWFGWNDYYGGHAFLYGSSFTKRGIIAVGLFTGGALWYKNSEVGSENRHLEMHIFDPVHLGEVVQSSRPAKDVQPTSYKLVTDAPTSSTEPTYPCVTWDAVAKRLYVSWFAKYGGSFKNRVLVYSVNA
jgi:hypothetical protein